jgi:hypothetical protein
MKIGIIDADLLDNGTRHPNLALMKISGYLKENNDIVELITNYNDVEKFEKIYMSKVFSFTNVPEGILERDNLVIGGTGFYEEKAEDLPYEIEHHFPDYHLYDDFVGKEIARGIKAKKYSDYLDYSIGFATRGCFRKCSFCVNKKYSHVFRHAKVEEFYDKKRKYIYLWDDNFLGYSKWNEVIEELEATNRRFQFRQGLDIRLLNEEKAKRLSKVKYHGDYIFAFDYWKDREIIEKNLHLWRQYTEKTTKLYILCAYESTDKNDIESIFKRIHVLMKNKCIPYIMRYKGWEKSKHRGMYINIARWANQPNFFKKKSFREYCEANGENSSTMRYLSEFEKKYPDLSAKYFDLKYENHN